MITQVTRTTDGYLRLPQNCIIQDFLVRRLRMWIIKKTADQDVSQRNGAYHGQRWKQCMTAAEHWARAVSHVMLTVSSLIPSSRLKVKVRGRSSASASRVLQLGGTDWGRTYTWLADNWFTNSDQGISRISSLFTFRVKAALLMFK